MGVVTNFDSTKESLLDILVSVRDGRTQLPDFQRGWVWDDDRIKSVLASVSLAFPIGAVMMLQTGNPLVRLKPRPVEGVLLDPPVEPERLILDGQQRLTSLYRALMCDAPVKTRDVRGHEIQRYYYVRMAKALDRQIDREEAILSVPETRKVLHFGGGFTDYSTPEREYEEGIFPMWLLADFGPWRRGYNKHFRNDEERLDLLDRFEREVLDVFKQYQVPVILLRRDTPKEAVCLVFEKVNTGGVPLNVFELLTATFAASNFNLREDWAQREKRLRKHAVLADAQNTDFLQAVTLLASRARRLQAIEREVPPDSAPGVSCKRKEILDLALEEYERWAEPVTVAFEKAAELLAGQCLFAARDLPYVSQLVPLAATSAILGDRAADLDVRAKLIRWYWCGVFGELYGSALETRYARDLVELLNWVDGGPEPSTITDANFSPTRLLTMRTRNSAAYKGLAALLLRHGAMDFKSGKNIDAQRHHESRVDIHPIFPWAWAEKQRIPRKRVNSIVNKTPLSAGSRSLMASRAPSVYTTAIESAAGGRERADEILRSHVLDPSLLRADDFEAFLRDRADKLVALIESVTGKPIPRAASSAESEPDDESPDEEEQE